MDRLSTLLPKVLRKHGIKDEADASLVVHRANIFLHQKNLTEGVTATTYEQGTVCIEVTTSILSQETYTVSDELLHELRAQFPHCAIEQIRIVREKSSMAD
jgi:hypothetical protein